MRGAYVDLVETDGQNSNGQIGEQFEVNGAMYVYTKANAIIPAFSACYLLTDGTMGLATPTLLTTTKPTFVVVPQIAFASGDYGWVFCGPGYLAFDNATTLKVISKIAAVSVQMYATTTAGSVDDAVSAPIILGMTLSAAQTVDDTATPFIATRRMTTTA